MWWSFRPSNTYHKFQASKAHKKKIQEKAKNDISKLEEKLELQSKLKLFDKLNLDELKILCKLNDLKTTGKKEDLLRRLNETEVTKELNSISQFEVTVRYLELMNNKPHTDLAKIPSYKKRKLSDFVPQIVSPAAIEMGDANRPKCADEEAKTFA